MIKNKDDEGGYADEGGKVNKVIKTVMMMMVRVVEKCSK